MEITIEIAITMTSVNQTKACNVPFVYGRPVRPDEFVGRHAELRTVFNRLRNGEATAIHIGKSSLLLALADPMTQRSFLGCEAKQWVTTSV